MTWSAWPKVRTPVIIQSHCRWLQYILDKCLKWSYITIGYNKLILLRGFCRFKNESLCLVINSKNLVVCKQGAVVTGSNLPIGEVPIIYKKIKTYQTSSWYFHIVLQLHFYWMTSWHGIYHSMQSATWKMDLAYWRFLSHLDDYQRTKSAR